MFTPWLGEDICRPPEGNLKTQSWSILLWLEPDPCGHFRREEAGVRGRVCPVPCALHRIMDGSGASPLAGAHMAT